VTTLLSRFDAKNKASAASLQALLFELRDAVRSEPGYLSYRVFSAREEPDTFWVLEIWETQDERGSAWRVHRYRRGGRIGPAPYCPVRSRPRRSRSLTQFLPRSNEGEPP